MTVNQLIEALLEVRDIHGAGELQAVLVCFAPASMEPALSGYAVERIELRELPGVFPRQCILSDAESIPMFELEMLKVRN